MRHNDQQGRDPRQPRRNALIAALARSRCEVILTARGLKRGAFTSDELVAAVEKMDAAEQAFEKHETGAAA